MMKKLFLVLAMVASACAWAESEVVDGVTWYYTTERTWDSASKLYITNAYVTSGANAYTGDLVVPSTLGGYAVKRIGYAAFRDFSSLKSVVIPEGVTSIGGEAFSGCSSLMSVVIPEGVMSIDYQAFSGCSSLKLVVIPSSVTSIDNYVFYGCSSLTSVVIPSSVKSIGSYAFYGCSSLKSVTIPEGVTSIGNYAFYGCSSLASATILEGVTSIGEYAFYSCSSLERFDVPASVTSMGEHVVRWCKSLTVITVAEGNANYKCVNNCIVSSSGTTLVAVPFGCEKVDIPVGVTSIGSAEFLGCSSLKSVTIPEGVTSIGEMAFNGCRLIESIVIPASVTSIGAEAFRCTIVRNMTAFKDVTLLGAPPSGVENSYLLSYSYQNITYPREYGAAWMAVINDVNKFRGYNRKQPEVAVVSSKIRASDPTILDVVYKVTSSQPTVKVRALAFEDGVRSFANVVRPETFVADTNGVATAGNVGDAIVPNVEHTLSWRVASDWSNRLAKVAFEVLASEGELLPLEVRTIPASEQYGKMDVTWNAITESQWYDALMWLYADKNKKVTITDGKYFYDGKIVANGTTMYYNKSAGSYYSRTYDYSVGKQQVYVYVYYMNVQEAVFDAMGYKVLTGDVLNYANDETRLGLSPSGFRQYGYKIVSEK